MKEFVVYAGETDETRNRYIGTYKNIEDAERAGEIAEINNEPAKYVIITEEVQEEDQDE